MISNLYLVSVTACNMVFLVIWIILALKLAPKLSCFKYFFNSFVMPSGGKEDTFDPDVRRRTLQKGDEENSRSVRKAYSLGQDAKSLEQELRVFNDSQFTDAERDKRQVICSGAEHCVLLALY